MDVFHPTQSLVQSIKHEFQADNKVDAYQKSFHLHVVKVFSFLDAANQRTMNTL
jgi:hypothetical protein